MKDVSDHCPWINIHFLKELLDVNLILMIQIHINTYQNSKFVITKSLRMRDQAKEITEGNDFYDITCPSKFLDLSFWFHPDFSLLMFILLLLCWVCNELALIIVLVVSMVAVLSFTGFFFLKSSSNINFIICRCWC